MKDIGLVFILNVFSKAVVLFVSLVMISVLTEKDYAEYTVVYTFLMLVFQLVVGIVERLYIVEYDDYIDNEWAYNFIISFFILFMSAACLLLYNDLSVVFVVMFLSLFSIVFQIKRIRFQKEGRFKKYSGLEIYRNVTWGVMVLALLWFYESGDYIYILLLYGFVTFVFSLPLNANVIGKGNKEGFTDSVLYVFSKKYLILYSVVAGLFPYFAFLYVSVRGSEIEISSLGAAMRYQALFSMLVMSVNLVVISKINDPGSNRTEELKNIWKGVSVLTVLSVLFIALVWFLIPWVDGGKYPDSRDYFLLLSLTSIVSLIGVPVVNFLVSLRRYKEMFYSLSIALMVSFISFYVFDEIVDQHLIVVLLSMIVAYASNFLINLYRYFRVGRDESFNN